MASVARLRCPTKSVGDRQPLHPLEALELRDREGLWSECIGRLGVHPPMPISEPELTDEQEATRKHTGTAYHGDPTPMATPLTNLRSRMSRELAIAEKRRELDALISPTMSRPASPEPGPAAAPGERTMALLHRDCPRRPKDPVVAPGVAIVMPMNRDVEAEASDS